MIAGEPTARSGLFEPRRRRPPPDRRRRFGRQLAEARAADRRQTAQQQRVRAELDRLDARVATYRGEQDRRARLSPEDRRAEDQYRARQTPEPLAPPPTPGATASVEASPHSTRDTDTGPAL